MAAVCAAGLTQLPYLIQRGGRQWALCMASLALLYGAAALLPDLLPESAAEHHVIFDKFFVKNGA